MKKISIIFVSILGLLFLFLIIGSMLNKKHLMENVKKEECSSLNTLEKTDCLMKKQTAFDFKYSNKYYQLVKGKKTLLEFEIREKYIVLKRVDQYKNNLICNTKEFIRDIGDDFISFYGYKKEQILACRHALDNEPIYFISESVSMDLIKESDLPSKIDFSKRNQYPEGAIFN